MRLLKRIRVLAAGFGLIVSLSVLLGSRGAFALEEQGGMLAGTAFTGFGAIIGALALFPMAKRMRLRAAHHAELVQLAGVAADNPHPILRIAASGEVRYANAAANALLGRIGAD